MVAFVIARTTRCKTISEAIQTIEVVGSFSMVCMTCSCLGPMEFTLVEIPCFYHGFQPSWTCRPISTHSLQQRCVLNFYIRRVANIEQVHKTCITKWQKLKLCEQKNMVVFHKLKPAAVNCYCNIDALSDWIFNLILDIGLVLLAVRFWLTKLISYSNFWWRMWRWEV